MVVLGGSIRTGPGAIPTPHAPDCIDINNPIRPDHIGISGTYASALGMNTVIASQGEIIGEDR
jgi:hypothetical protein